MIKVIKYNKLIRDRIPEIIKENNQIPEMRILNRKEFAGEIKKKILEEAKELVEAKDKNVNPPLLIEAVPAEAKSLVLLVDDPDAPAGVWSHWLVFNIAPGTKEIKENSVPEGAVLGSNDFGKLAYGGPCPPSGIHRYSFRIYALDTNLDLPSGAKSNVLQKAMENHILDQGEFMGRYSR